MATLPLLLTALVLFPLGGRAAEITGFAALPPTVPGEHPDLVVEQLWDFPENDMKPTRFKFVPGSDSSIITIHKAGEVRWCSDVTQGVCTVLLDLSDRVWSLADHGLMSFEFHPEWEAGVHKLFVMYTGEPKDTAALPNSTPISAKRPWGVQPTAAGYQWGDVCPDLGANNLAGQICEHPYYIDRLAVDLDAAAPSAAVELTLLTAACGSSSTHGPGDMLLIGGDLAFANGDGSQYAVLDPGFAEDGCLDPTISMPQGVFRAARDEFMNGKVVRIPAALLDSKKQLTHAQVEHIAKGLRNPWSMFYRQKSDTLYIGDVGYGDAGTSERIFGAEGVQAAMNETQAAKAAAIPNFGWPCVEGVRTETMGQLGAWDSVSEQERYAYLEAENYDTCAAVQASVQAYVAGEPLPADGDAAWQPPLFEYRAGVMDAEFPALCANPTGAITSVFYYEGTNLPKELQDKLLFSDFTKQCLWSVENDADGAPDFSKLPTTVLAGSGFISMATGPDGFLYGLDYANGRMVRMRQLDLDAGETVAPTAAPTAEFTASPAAVASVAAAGSCFDPKEMPMLPWDRADDGSYEGTLTLSAVELTTDAGTMRTRAYNGLIPGPIISMKACGTYHLNLVNDLAEWPAPAADTMNTFHDPTVTNLHLHGLHISGESPGDDVFTVVAAGETGKYTYVIPCDHSGGTNWYHPHHHGSSALQTGGGAAGMLIIESSAREASDMPQEIAALPEQYLTIQEFSPADLQSYATASGDALFSTTIAEPFTLTNGCKEAAMTVEADQWHRIRILNSGHTYNSVLSIVADGTAATATAAAAAQCDIVLLGKDGVWVSPAPRAVPGNKMFLTMSSRIDIAIRCPRAGAVHSILYQNIRGATAQQANAAAQQLIGTITAVASARKAAPDLPVWTPCRPNYLVDLTATPAQQLGANFNLEVREGINGQLYSAEPDEFVHTMEVNKPQQWRVTGTDVHPLHVHVNHMQLAVAPKVQWSAVPRWFQAGDWVDTLSLPGAAAVLVKPERFNGSQVLHCHVSAHADQGVMAVMNIEGKGSGALASPAVTKYGTCSKLLPVSTPYDSGSLGALIPGTIEAEHFDVGGEGIAYHNINIATNAAPSAARPGDAVELLEDAVTGVTAVQSIRRGEWLKYTVQVSKTAFYTASISQASVTPAAGMQWSLWVDAAECPAPSTTVGLLGRVKDPLYAGTGEYANYANSVSEQPGALTAGEHTLLLCFEVDGYMLVDSITVEACGATAAACGAPAAAAGHGGSVHRLRGTR